MFDSSELRDELQALKGDVSRLLNTAGEGIFDASKNRDEALADQIKAALSLAKLWASRKTRSRISLRIDRSHRSPQHSRLALLSAPC
jgi:hypothetical protein